MSSMNTEDKKVLFVKELTMLMQTAVSHFLEICKTLVVLKFQMGMY